MDSVIDVTDRRDGIGIDAELNRNADKIITVTLSEEIFIHKSRRHKYGALGRKEIENEVL